MADFIFTDEGDFISAAAVKFIKQSGDALLIYFQNGANSPKLSNLPPSNGEFIKYQYTSAAIASVQFNKYTAMILSAPVALSFISISPNTGTKGSPAHYTGTLTGTGFFASGINAVKFDDGAGNVIQPFNSNIKMVINTDSNATISFSGVPAPNVATYTVYYSVDGGTNWITTGLTVAFS